MIHRRICFHLAADVSDEEAKHIGKGLDDILEDVDARGRIQELMTVLLESRGIENIHPFFWSTK